LTQPNPTLQLTIGGLLARAANLWGRRTALVFDGQSLTYEQLLDQARRHANMLSSLGIAKGDKVGLWLPNCATWFHLQHACALLGAVVVPLNTRYREHELSYLIGQSDVSVLVVTEQQGGIEFLPTLAKVLPHLTRGRAAEAERVFPMLRHILIDRPTCEHHGTHSLQTLLALAPAPASSSDPALVSDSAVPDDPYTLLYTSGTTAAPKGAVISHRNTVPHGWFCAQASGIDESDRILLSVPLCGSWGGLCIPNMAWSHGAAIVLTERYDARETLELFEREGVTFWPAVDAMAMGVIDHPDFAKHDHSSLRGGWFVMNTGGRDGLFEEIVRKLGVRVAFQPYGMSEINSVALYHRPDETVDARSEPGGWPAQGLEVRLVDVETQEPIEGAGQGEMQFRGPLVTRGYHHKPDETAAAFTEDGWFRTGDLARRNEDGRLVFLSRLREALRINHFMVSPREIEECVMQMPAVHQCFVIGVPDTKLGEAVGAYVIPAAGAQPTVQQILGHCRSHMASYKVPVHVRIVDDVPRTPGPHGDKAQKGKLKQMLLDELKRMSVPA
jgi:fatty-acyl-CoA synthase